VSSFEDASDASCHSLHFFFGFRELPKERFPEWRSRESAAIDENESVIGEPAKQAVTSARTESGFAISQCYFQTATPAKSVAVTVTSRGPGSEAKEPRQFWAEKFHGEGNAEKEGEEAQRRPAPPEKVEGVGDEAYWIESGSTGALYAIQANRFIRVAIGGSDGKAIRIDKAKRLAELVLKRLPAAPDS
jgi:hypothetical protein